MCERPSCLILSHGENNPPNIHKYTLDTIIIWNRRIYIDFVYVSVCDYKAYRIVEIFAQRDN